MKAGPVFTFPLFDETGLGNKLIVWAKCAAWSRRNGAIMLDPEWDNRHSEDPGRRYLDLFSPKSRPYRRLRGLALRAFRQISYAKGLTVSERTMIRPVVVTFAGLDDAELIQGESRYIGQRLLSKINPAYVLRKQFRPFIAVHVRRGDFQEASEDALRQGFPNARQPIRWYRAVIEALREALGEDVPVRLFSDGEDSDLQGLLCLPNTARSGFENPLLDLQAMARAACILGSRSTFTASASYLGQVPTVYFPGARAAVIPLVEGSGEAFVLEPEWDYGQAFPRAFIAGVRDRLGGGSGGQRGALREEMAAETHG